MESNSCHIVAIPYPGRGHINAMFSFCNILASKKPSKNFHVTFVVTEEWLRSISCESDYYFYNSDTNSALSLCFETIPNVIPSAAGRAAAYNTFFQSVLTKMEAPFEHVLDRIQPPATAIVADTFLPWVVRVGNRRNIPVASLFPMSAMVFSIFHHFDLFVQNGHYPVDFLGSEDGEEYADYIPGVTATNLRNLPYSVFSEDRKCIKDGVMEGFESVKRAQYLLFCTVYELDHRVVDILRTKFSFPIYTIGPAIPYFKLNEHSNSTLTTNFRSKNIGYLAWLDCQPPSSILYVSLGSFLSVSGAQMDEIVAGLCQSGVKFVLVAREEFQFSKSNESCGDKGLIVGWCDQLKVLCHPSIGGFWSHCGWNSVQEGVFAGVPFLTFPLGFEQNSNSKLIVEDWKIGCEVKKNIGGKNIVGQEEIAKIVRNFMDLGTEEGKAMRKRAKELQENCKLAILEGGSSESNINAFIQDISSHHKMA